MYDIVISNKSYEWKFLKNVPSSQNLYSQYISRIRLKGIRVDVLVN